MRYIFLLSLTLFFAACSDDTDSDLPACIQSYSDDFAENACEGTGDLTRWTFNGRNVYCFNPGTCIADGAAEIFDENCNFLCLLGGISGNVICVGLDWNTNATLEETIYTY